MQTTSAEALLLQVTDLQEGDRIVTLLTRERGKVRGVARGAKRKYSRFAGQLQPLAKVKVTWFEKEGRDLVRVSGVELLQPPTKLTADLEGILLASCLAETLVELVQENEPAELYFRLLDSTLAALVAGIDRDLAARWFETWALRLAGVFPPPEQCALCGNPLLPDGAVLPASAEGLVCRDCGGGGGLAVRPEVVVALLRFGGSNLPRLAEEPPEPAVIAAIEEIAGRVRRAFLQKELKSYTVMRDTLSSLGPAAGTP